MTAIHRLSATQLAACYRDRSLSPVEVLEASLARSQLVQEKLNAFLMFDTEQARAAAAQSARRWAECRPLSELDGVPLAIKDTDAFIGHRRTVGSLANQDQPPVTTDSLHIGNLRAAGVVVFGRTNMPDRGWKGVGDGPLAGVVRNPWNPAMTPGGSSAGSAVAVATGGAAIATGTDGGGSVRIPAAFSGVYGIKPTSDRVPNLHDSSVGDMVAPGPLTRSVQDAALVLDVMCQPSPRDPLTASLPIPDFVAATSAGVKGLTVAVSPTCGFATIDASRLGPLHEAAEALEGAGAKVEWADPPAFNLRDEFIRIWEAGYAASVASLPGEKLALLDPGLIETAARGLRLSAVEEKQAQQRRIQLMHIFIAFLSRYDLLLTPAIPIAPFAAGHGVNTPDAAKHPTWFDWTPYTWVFNATKMPAASFPWGLDANRLPQAVQIVATHFREDLVFRASGVLEQTKPITLPADELWMS